MTDTTALTAHSTVGAWLAHPIGGELVRRLLTQTGVDEAQHAPVRALPLAQLVSLSRGSLPRSTIDALVLQANGGVWLWRSPPAPFVGQC